MKKLFTALAGLVLATTAQAQAQVTLPLSAAAKEEVKPAFMSACGDLLNAPRDVAIGYDFLASRGDRAEYQRDIDLRERGNYLQIALRAGSPRGVNHEKLMVCADRFFLQFPDKGAASAPVLRPQAGGQAPPPQQRATAQTGAAFASPLAGFPADRTSVAPVSATPAPVGGATSTSSAAPGESLGSINLGGMLGGLALAPRSSREVASVAASPLQVSADQGTARPAQAQLGDDESRCVTVKGNHFFNSCRYKVAVSFCVLNPGRNSVATMTDCAKNSFSLVDVPAETSMPWMVLDTPGADARVQFMACRPPYGARGASFQLGRGIIGVCRL